jgi:acyl carrier protein
MPTPCPAILGDHVIARTERICFTMAARQAQTCEMIRSIWVQVLDRRNFSDDEIFFSLGGNSIMAIQVTTLLKKRCGIEISLRDFFANSTVRKLAQLLLSRGATTEDPAGVRR